MSCVVFGGHAYILLASQGSICLVKSNSFHCRPRWYRGNVLALRSKVRGFKHGWGRWIFSGRKNPEHKSSGRDFKLGGSESEISGSLKNLKPEKIGLWAKFNRHIHVLVIPEKVAVHWEWLPHQNKYKNTKSFHYWELAYRSQGQWRLNRKRGRELCESNHSSSPHKEKKNCCISVRWLCPSGKRT